MFLEIPTMDDIARHVASAWAHDISRKYNPKSRGKSRLEVQPFSTVTSSSSSGFEEKLSHENTLLNKENKESKDNNSFIEHERPNSTSYNVPGDTRSGKSGSMLINSYILVVSLHEKMIEFDYMLFIFY